MIRKCLLVPSLLTIGRLFLLELIKESSYGIPEERTSSPVKRATIRIG